MARLREFKISTDNLGEKKANVKGKLASRYFPFSLAVLLEMIYRHTMSTFTRPSASIIAAGVVAILGSLLVILGTGMSLFAYLFVNVPTASFEQPPYIRIVSIITMVVAIACAIFGIATGIGL